MAFSGGVFSRLYDWTTDRDNGVKILASRMDQEFDGIATGLSTCILKDGTQTCTAAVPFAEGLTIPDDKTLVFGTDSDVTIQYDETTNNALEIAANVEGAALGVVLKADQGDDNADQWKVNVADGGTLSINSKISGSFVSQLTLTPNATAASSTTAIAGNITVGGTVDGRDLATDGSKLDGIEASADVTDTANVTAAGALMDSEVTNLAQVKSFDSADYATAAQGSTADSALQNVSEDSTPQLGGSLDVNGNSIVSASNGNIAITPNGTGSVVIDGLSHPQADGSAGQFLKTDGSGQLSFATPSAGLTNVVDDTSPQLGGNLDVQTNSIVSTSNRDINISPNGTGTVVINTDLDVDNININGNIISSTDTNGDINVTPNGTGDVVLGGDVKIADSDVLYLGTGLDLQIQHNGSGSFITDAGTGDLHIRTDTNLNIQNAAGSESKAVFATDGAVTLYHDNSAKIATSAAGIDVTGTVTSDGASLDGAVVINESSNDVDFRVESNGNANMLFVDASADKIGVGTNAPSESVHSTGAIMSTGVATTAVASSSTLDFTSGNMRLITRGADTSTRGGLQVISQASNGGSSLNALTIDTSGNTTLGGTLTQAGTLAVVAELGAVAFTSAGSWVSLGAISVPQSGIWVVRADLRLRGSGDGFVKARLGTSSSGGEIGSNGGGGANTAIRMLSEQIEHLGSFYNIHVAPSWILDCPTGATYPLAIYIHVQASASDSQALNNNDSNGHPTLSCWRVHSTSTSGSTVETIGGA